MAEAGLTSSESTAAGSPAGVGVDEPWDLVIRPRRHLFDVRLRELWDYRDLLVMFVRRDMVTVYKQTVLGPVWFFVQPILTTVVFLFVFGRIAKISTDGIPGILFYLSGIVVWNYFAESFTRTSSTFVTNATVFGKVYFPRLIVPLALIASGFIKFLIQFMLFFVVWIWYLLREDIIHPSLWLLSLPWLLVLMAGLGLGLGIIFSSLTTKYRDLTFLIQFGVQLGMYATPIIYPMSTLSAGARRVLWWNPIAHIIEAFKHAFLGVGEASPMGILYSTVFVLLTVIAGIVIFNHTEQTFMDTV